MRSAARAGSAAAAEAAVTRAAGSALVHARTGSGAGTPVLLLHGITGSRHYWDGIADHLAASRPVVAVDLMGFGASPKPPVRHDMAGHALALRSFLEVHGLAAGPLDIVAHSLGGLIALEYALTWPGHVQRAVLASLPAHPTRAEAHGRFLAGSGNYRRIVGENSVRAMLSSWRQAGPAMACRYAFAFSRRIAADSRSWTHHSLTSTIEHCLLAHRVAPHLEALAAQPASLRPELLLLHGASDQVTPLVDVQAVWPLLGQAVPLHVIAGTGHHPFRTHARACIALAHAHLDRPREAR